MAPAPTQAMPSGWICDSHTVGSLPSVPYCILQGALWEGILQGGSSSATFPGLHLVPGRTVTHLCPMQGLHTASFAFSLSIDYVLQDSSS